HGAAVRDSRDRGGKTGLVRGERHIEIHVVDQATVADRRRGWALAGLGERQGDDREHDDQNGSCPHPARASFCHDQKVPALSARGATPLEPPLCPPGGRPPWNPRSVRQGGDPLGTPALSARGATPRASQPLGCLRMEISSAVPAQIDEFWEHRAELSPDDTEAAKLITAAVEKIDSGEVRV